MKRSHGQTLAVALALAALLVPSRAQALENETLLALVAMPLAVAAVSEIVEVPMNDLVDVITILNDAEVPPPQFIEVIRYVPIALVVDEQAGAPAFVRYVRLREAQGLRETQLVTSIEDRLRLYDIDVMKLSVERPRVIDIDEHFLPNVVRARLQEAKEHPHGGPPGQLKKQQHVQTGAEVVHDDRGRRTASQRVTKSRPRPKKVTVHEKHGNGKGHH
ncbi:MAG TPA: hypothetical protein VHW00_26000 [Thermoanaerobaculia bacterium]|nr:hypothetical protein [Thermoanaerobaculia bacterium]